MNTKLALASMAVIIGALQPASLMAEPSEYRAITITPMAGFIDFDSSRGLDDEGVLSLGLGWRINEKWTVETTYLRADTDDPEASADVEFTAWRIDGLYHVDSGYAAEPYWIIGVGENSFDNEISNENFINYGVGIYYRFNESVAWRTELRGVTVDSGSAEGSSSGDTDFMLSTGLQFDIGF